MVRSDKDKSTRVNCDWKKLRKVNAPIILEDLMVNELPPSIEDGDIRELEVPADPTNDNSTHIK